MKNGKWKMKNALLLPPDGPSTNFNCAPRGVLTVRSSIIVPMTTALAYDPAYLKHETGHHPENPQRLKVIISALQRDESLWTRLQHLRPRQVTDDDIMRCHSYRLIDQIRSLCERGVPFVDLDTAICAQSFEIARLAAGAATV